MENPEELLHALEEFSKVRPKTIPRELEEYLWYVAKTGDPVYQWASVKSLFHDKLAAVISDFHDSAPTFNSSNGSITFDSTQSPNVEPFNYCSSRNFILSRINDFAAAPFTIQRLCELLTSPRKEYSRLDKYMRALEKNVLVVSTIEPGLGRHNHNRHGVPENGANTDGLMNGLEVHHHPHLPMHMQHQATTIQHEISVDVDMDVPVTAGERLIKGIESVVASEDAVSLNESVPNTDDTNCVSLGLQPLDSHLVGEDTQFMETEETMTGDFDSDEAVCKDTTSQLLEAANITDPVNAERRRSSTEMIQEPQQHEEELTIINEQEHFLIEQTPDNSSQQVETTDPTVAIHTVLADQEASSSISCSDQVTNNDHTHLITSAEVGLTVEEDDGNTEENTVSTCAMALSTPHQSSNLDSGLDIRSSLSTDSHTTVATDPEMIETSTTASLESDTQNVENVEEASPSFSENSLDSIASPSYTQIGSPATIENTMEPYIMLSPSYRPESPACDISTPTELNSSLKHDACVNEAQAAAPKDLVSDEDELHKLDALPQNADDPVQTTDESCQEPVTSSVHGEMPTQSDL